MTVNDLCDAYNKVANNHGLPEMTCTALGIETNELADSAAAWQALCEQHPSEGWLLFQSHVAIFLAGVLPEPDPDWGCLLAAEAVNEHKRSIHIRQVDAGGWRLIVANPNVTANADNTFLIDQIRHLATEKAPGPLCHCRYWRSDPALGFSPVFAAFQGFARQEDA